MRVLGGKPSREELHEQADQVVSRADFVRFVEAMRTDLKTNPDEWESLTLDDFLESLGAWVNDSAHMPTDTSKPVWWTMAQTIFAAKVYE
jgi:hypothetical protein